MMLVTLKELYNLYQDDNLHENFIEKVFLGTSIRLKNSELLKILETVMKSDFNFTMEELVVRNYNEEFSIVEKLEFYYGKLFDKFYVKNTEENFLLPEKMYFDIFWFIKYAFRGIFHEKSMELWGLIELNLGEYYTDIYSNENMGKEKIFFSDMLSDLERVFPTPGKKTKGIN